MKWSGRIESRNLTISVFGMGYVGLPTALHFAKTGFNVIGVDIDADMADRLNKGVPHLKELKLDNMLKDALKNKGFYATTDGTEATEKADVILICVPTPVDEAKTPDLTYVTSASAAIAKGLGKNKLVVLESTVYPGCCEDIVKPVLEGKGLMAGKDFGLAHVPERYNPGDLERTLEKMVRVVGAISEPWAKITAEIYKTIVPKVHIVRDLKTAEAAKIIENVQRDLNIALMNEFALIFRKLGVDVFEVIEAAGTKWNFVKYYPGAGVGGHCLPVDPYYLTYKAEELNYRPKIILAGRGVNDSMPEHIFDLVVEGLNDAGRAVKDSKVVILGVSYKKNTSDMRNSPSNEVIKLLEDKGARVYTFDPWIEKEKTAEISTMYSDFDEVVEKADCLVLLVDHDEFRNLDLNMIKSKAKSPCVIVDGKGFFDPSKLKSSGFVYKGVGRPEQ